ncbi:MAG: D-alanine--D-alanine ligase [Candidatus Portnoybacteria bacterium CG23_combo_of_CG06-09_8_20_14_all_37_13]|uniref:D-alanine--D-alanine ligase n=1 Tax=Candidatus Portnoybacteria bacterium CG23_combo_of_CG06-09_8_20_14_all_37_13 TaxID=1974819 RepID=A0A2G9YE93_9BACT|nr:MAG: D-alanine--D-alanine ligase [Candidatus Portnoybacteria bacterium CG23_combo_of_CG06-09_8_20_14_all_37_13]
MTKQTIAVLFGGRSVEHEVSILTGLQIIHAFDKERFNVVPIYVCKNNKWWTGKKLWDKDFYKNINFKKLKNFDFKKQKIDVFFPAFHGTYGEDGCIQGFFEILNKPYVGPRILAAAISMSKSATKQICIANKIPVLDYILLNKNDWEVKNFFDFPVFVKPNNLGSSIGVSSAKNEHQLQMAIAGAFIFDYQVIVEPQIKSLLEINCAISDGEVSELEEPQKDADILSFEQKYLKAGKKLSIQGMASMQRVLDPKSITLEQKEQIQNYSKEIYKILDGSGVWRIDFMIDKDKNQIYLNEINSIPGSLAYYLWPKISFTELLTQLVESAIKKYEQKNSINLRLERKIFNA